MSGWDLFLFGCIVALYVRTQWQADTIAAMARELDMVHSRHEREDDGR
jgi:hypothetical protein